MRPSVKRYIANRADHKRWKQSEKDAEDFRLWYLSVAKNEGYIPNK